MNKRLIWQRILHAKREEALLACRLILRSIREKKVLKWQTHARQFLLRARSQLKTLAGAKALIGKLEWVPFSSSTAVSDPTLLRSEFGKWALAGGPTPTDVSKMNCWEMIIFAAYQKGMISFKKIKQIYKKAVKDVRDRRATSVGFVLKNYLRASDVKIFDPADPNSPEPLPGDIIVFNEARNHAAISLGTKTSAGKHEVISHWVRPGHTKDVKKTTIEKLLSYTGTSVNVRFWSAKW